MLWKLCLNCMVTCWHNRCAVDRGHRCTFCGHPVGHNSGSSAKEHAEKVRDKQANRARLLGLRTSGGGVPWVAS